jgi:hypothetical protein
MTRAQKKEPSHRNLAAAYWEVYYGLLGKDTGEILKDLLAPKKEEDPDWVQVDAALRERFGWVADVIREKAEKLARREGEEPGGDRPPTHRRPRR